MARISSPNFDVKITSNFGYVFSKESISSLQIANEIDTHSSYVIQYSKTFGQGAEFGPKSRIRWQDVHSEDDVSAGLCALKYDGVPYVILGSKVLECHHGRDWQETVKRRRKEQRRMEFSQGRLHVKATKKLGCPATLAMREVMKFPEFKIVMNTKNERTKAATQIKKALEENKPVGERRFYVRLPTQDDHKGHDVEENPVRMSSNEVNAMGVNPVVLVHGGAWAIPDDLVEASKAGVQNAARAGYRTLKQAKGTALDAVVAAVCVLEDDPAFDAGTGSVLNEEGEVEMDSVVMEGRELRAGSIACVKNIKNPVKLARLVLEKTDHTMLVGKGANKFAKAMRMREVPMSSLINAKAIEDFEHYKKYKKVVDDCFHSRSQGHDTVGAVAVDRHGNVACATSTGGIAAKMVGRVGDSPIIGSGAYCDNASGAASTTGHGESIVKVTLARQVLYNMQNGDNAQQAAEKAISYMSSRVNGSGGTIAVSNTGDIGICFSTERMPWAWAKSGSLHYGINPGEDFTVTRGQTYSKSQRKRKKGSQQGI